jgi:hypothetical protein
MLDEATGELTERRLDHQAGEAGAFYRNLQGRVAALSPEQRRRFSGKRWRIGW